MPKKCSLLHCSSKYDTDGDRYSTYSFPCRIKFPDLFEKWLEFSGFYSHEITKYTFLCERHFAPACFNKGEPKTLKKGAVPTILEPHDSDEISEITLQTDVDPSKKVSRPSRQVLPFNDLLIHCIDSYQNSDLFMIRILPDCFILFIQETSEPFNNLFTLSVFNNKSVKFFSCGKEINRKHFDSYFTKPYFITSTEDFDKLVFYISENYHLYCESNSKTETS